MFKKRCNFKKMQILKRLNILSAWLSAWLFAWLSALRKVIHPPPDYPSPGYLLPSYLPSYSSGYLMLPNLTNQSIKLSDGDLQCEWNSDISNEYGKNFGHHYPSLISWYLNIFLNCNAVLWDGEWFFSEPLTLNVMTCFNDIFGQ